MAKPLVIFGNSKMAQLAHFYFTKDSEYEVAAFTVDQEHIKQEQFLDKPVIPFEVIQKEFPPGVYSMFVALGYRNLNQVREKKFHEAKRKGYTLASYLCSKSTYWDDLVIGENCFILENQVMQMNVKIGDNTFVWSGNHFGHDVTTGGNCWISSHVVLSGGVLVGPNTFIGINVSVRDGVTIGSECIIGAGAIIQNSLMTQTVYIEKSTPKYRLTSPYFEKMSGVRSAK